jgi:hypothetical protein
MVTSTHPTDPNYLAIGLDWLTANVTAEPQQLVTELAHATGLEPRTMRPYKGYGYSSAVGLYGGDEPTYAIQVAPNRNPLVVATGSNADSLQALLANRYPHRCTAPRKDACIHLGDPDWFDVLVASTVAIANRRGITLDNKGDWFVDGSPKGRTLYAGSRQSECYLRIYEYRKFHHHGAHVSVELEFKPQGPEAKLWTFTATPREILGRSPLVTELLSTVGVDISRTVPRLTTKAPTSLERATMALLHQYGKLLRDRILPTLDNDPARLGPHLIAALSRLEREREAVSAAAHNRTLTANEAVPVG